MRYCAHPRALHAITIEVAGFRVSSLILGATLCGPAFQPAAAQTAPAPQQTETVVVTATRSPEALSNLPQSVSIVTTRQIANTPAQGLDDILRNLPGMTLDDFGPDVGHPTAYSENMRGLPSTETRMLVMVDGVPVNDPFFGYIQWNFIPLDNISRVEIVRGGGSPLWGNSAMGGVVNVITRAPQTDELDLSAAGGSYDSYATSLYGAWADEDWVAVGLNAAFTGTQGYQTTPDSWTSFGTPNLRSPLYTPTTNSAENIGLRADFAPAPDLSGFVDIHYHENQQVLSTPIGLNSQHVWAGAAGLTKTFDADTTLTATFFHDDSAFLTDNPHLLTFTTEYNSNTHVTDVSDNGASLILDRDFGTLLPEAEIGTDFHEISGYDDADYYAPSGVLAAPTIVGRGKQIFLAGFAQAQVKPMARLEIMGSVRYQYYLSENGIDTFPPGFGTIPDHTYYRATPRVDTRYQIDDAFALRGAYYQSFRAPTLDELYRTYADTTAGIYEGNPQLLPETLTGEEVGLDFTQPGLRSQFTLYNSTIDNLITTENLVPSQYPDIPGVTCGYDAATYTYLTCTRNINAASAVARGFEAGVNWDIGQGFSTELTYTYADSRYTSNPVDPAYVGERLEGVPMHNAGASLTYMAPAGWQITTVLRYISKSYGDPFPADGLIQNAHFVTDLSASYPLTRYLQAFVQIQNLFDSRYIANNSGGAPILGTPFEAMGGLRAKLE
ncbi:MAG TPA: TonB-dependent receptor [Rhizomicrobium sp.]|jgi:outer membrane cobalamin receptor|nr:TonB-dependent receptor [Rhizomicrobium sp.]